MKYVIYKISDDRYVNLSRVVNINVDRERSRICFNMDHTTEVFVKDHVEIRHAYNYMEVDPSKLDDEVDRIIDVCDKNGLTFVSNGDLIVNLEMVSSWHVNYEKLNIVFNMCNSVSHGGREKTDFKYFGFQTREALDEFVHYLTLI